MAYLLFRPVPLAKSLCHGSEDSNGLSCLLSSCEKCLLYLQWGNTLPTPSPPQKDATLLQKYFFHPTMCVT